MRPLPLFWRTIVLRVLLASVVVFFISSIVSCRQALGGVTIYIGLTMYIPPSFIFLHHILRLWSGKRWLWIYEILCGFAEVGGSIFANFYLWSEWIVVNPRYTGDLAMAASWAVLGVSVLMAFVILLWDTAAMDHGKKLLQQYDFSAGLNPSHPGHQWNFIFGTSSTRKRFSTDNRLIRWIRGALAILCLVILSLMAFYVFLGRPLWQRGRSTIKILKAPRDLLSKELEKLGNIEVSVILDMSDPQVDMQNLQESLPDSFANVTGTAKTPDILWTTAGDLASNSHSCHNISHPHQNSTSREVFCSFPVSFSFRSPPFLEILITVDFSAFKNASVAPSQVGVYPGVTRASTVSDTKPIFLGPGSHPYGLASISLKERSTSERFAAIGIPKYHLLPVLDVEYLFTDWSPPGGLNNDTASLRLLVIRQDEVKIQREYFESSVLDGFALIGGVWTFVNGLFAAIFGSTLLLVLFGIKPLSIYGLIHLFQTKSTLVGRDYVLSVEDRDWIIAILSEHLLDDDIKASRKLQLDRTSTKSGSLQDEKGCAEGERLIENGPIESA